MLSITNSTLLPTPSVRLGGSGHLRTLAVLAALLGGCSDRAAEVPMAKTEDVQPAAPKPSEVGDGCLDGPATSSSSDRPGEVYRPPSMETDLPTGKLGETIRYGRELVDRFPYYLGPKGSVGAFGGNGLGCSSCHLDAGTVPYGLNYFSVYGRYPQYRGREGEILTLAQRVNNCIQRPMNGQPMPLDSPEMVAIVSYMQWLGRGVPVGGRVEGDALMPLEIPDRAADPAAGKLVYEQFCQSCHQPDGQGVLAADGIAYQYPPVWGYMSYQPGSSMHRVMKSAMWIKNNMPRGVTWENPILTDQQAIDVAAYINDDDAHARPTSKESKAEYPHVEDKPVDYHEGPFADPFDQATHKFGPWGELRAWRKENGQFTGW